MCSSLFQIISLTTVKSLVWALSSCRFWVCSSRPNLLLHTPLINLLHQLFLFNYRKMTICLILTLFLFLNITSFSSLFSFPLTSSCSNWSLICLLRLYLICSSFCFRNSLISFMDKYQLKWKLLLLLVILSKVILKSIRSSIVIILSDCLLVHIVFKVFNVFILKFIVILHFMMLYNFWVLLWVKWCN